MDSFSFERLDIYEHSLKLVEATYELSEKFPSNERFGLYSQLRRAIISIPSNIAESCGRISYKEKTHFLEIAYGSLLESYCQLQIAYKLKYILETELNEIKVEFLNVSRMLTALSRSYYNSLTNKDNATNKPYITKE